MNNRQLAQAFANGKTRGNGSHMFIDGDTIYSYGYHFPIARHGDGFVYFNSRGYSNSTARHKSHVLNALSGFKVVELPDCNPSRAAEVLKHNVEEVARLEALNAKKPTAKISQSRAGNIRHIEQQNAYLRQLIGVN